MQKNYIYKLIIIFLLSAIYSGIGILILFFINRYIMTLQSPDYMVLIYFMLILILFFSYTLLMRVLVANINNNIIYELRTKFVLRILNSDLQTIIINKKSKILASLSKDITNISNGFMRLSDTLQGSLFVFISFFYFFYLSKELFVFIFIWFCLITIGAFYFIKKAHLEYKKARENEDILYNDYEVLLEGFKELSLNEKRANSFLNTFYQNANEQKLTSSKAEIYGNLSGNYLNNMMLGGIGMIIYLALGLGISDLKTAATMAISMMFLRAPFMMSIFSIPSVVLAIISIKKVKELKLISFDKIDFSKSSQAIKWSEIELRDISFSYGENLVLDRVNLKIKKGESIFLIGKNGSGKSTLFLILCGLLRADSGEIYIDNEILDEKNIKEFQNSISVVFSDFYLFKEILNSNEKSINYWIEILKMKDKVKVILKNEKLHFSSINLSLGQRKRVALIQALLEKRDFLMMDEFAADQDPEFRKYFYNEILNLLKEKGISIFAISHDDKYFDKSDKVYKIKNGKLELIKQATWR
ncbi:ABC transporter, ATP-binding/permease components [Campylobacter blaseri]|uniref:ABC transporter ATP-binding protein n=1 Tax=Campylobacter blaseri TaxID=2042961 RepID=A0A2P8R3Z8_9BACT|nr:ATP-binding cassette domain-containing protein [Campylobacter blaseri]PSM53232.1 ABC transporter ATP-binding protein [Campylobacter blaseri]PSM54698.1 ABC transporter ATP-binding protein [Campylobacter blaseri]QKF86819.1 ABC transporter, ATP-binding/permease components [Campylobacter blaseri]